MGLVAVIGAIAFWLLLLTGGTLVALSGIRPAQVFLVAILTATILTTITDTIILKSVAPYAYFAIDGFLLAFAIYCVITVNSYWPIWFAGFHAITVVCEISRLMLPGSFPELYADLGGFCSVLAFLAMVFGIASDRHFWFFKPNFRGHIN